MDPRRVAPALVVALLAVACATAPVATSPAPEPGMVAVPSGRFVMGWDDGSIEERPEHKVSLSEFAIDAHEVSATQFAEFLNVAGNEGDRYFTADADSTVVAIEENGARRFRPRPGFERHPANNVSWQGADAYCRWRGKRLPTEAEWEKAARGTDKRRYPWGNEEPDPRRATFARSLDRGGLAGALEPVDATAAGASPYGALQMAGSLREWVSDWYRQNLCDFCSPDEEANLDLVRTLTSGEGAPPQAGKARQAPPIENPSGPTYGSFKVLRGGAWSDADPGNIRTTARSWLDPAQRFPTTGIRCVKSLTRADKPVD